MRTFMDSNFHAIVDIYSKQVYIDYGNLLPQGLEVKKMSYLELYQLISKPWSSVKEISLIANCGRDNAIKIRNMIEQEIIKDGKRLPIGKTIVVPTKKVIEFLGLDLDYIV